MLSSHDYSRYSRHLLLPAFDEQAQLNLAKASVMIVGLGGLGCQTSVALATAGVGNLTLVDHDTVALSNLPRQWLYAESDVGAAKVKAAASRLSALSSSTTITVYQSGVEDLNVSKHLHSMRLILDCTDNMPARLAINEMAYAHQCPALTAAASGYVATCQAIHPDHHTACLHCLSPAVSEQQNCLEQGIFSPVVAIAGQLQAMQALHYLSGIQPVQWGELSYFNGSTGQMHHYTITKDPTCPVCQPSAAQRHSVGRNHANHL